MEEIVNCGYCHADVKMSLVEAEEGCCPECGSLIITQSTIFGRSPGGDGDEYVDDDDYNGKKDEAVYDNDDDFDFDDDDHE